MSANTTPWHHNFASLFHHAVPAPMLECLQQEADAIAQCDNFWISRADLENGSATTSGEAAISYLCTHILHDKLPTTWAGAEWWVQVYKPGTGLAFHFDKDEHAMKEKQQMMQPFLSSVLYLTGDSTHERLGPTAVIDQLFDAEQGRAVPEAPEKTALIFPYKNQYMLFDGRLGHGVLGSSSKQPRMTMLVNWWAEKPQDVNRITDEVIQQHSLSRIGPNPSAAATTQAKASSNNVDGGVDFPSRMQQLNLATQKSPHSATAPAPELHTALASSSTADATPGEQATGANSALQQHLPPSLEAPHSSQQQQQQQQEQQQPAEGAAGEPHGNAAGPAESAGHGPTGKQHMDREPKQLPVPCISIAGWDELPVSLQLIMLVLSCSLLMKRT